MLASSKVICLKFEKHFSQSSTFRSDGSRKILTIYLQSRIAEFGNYALWTAELGEMAVSDSLLWRRCQYLLHPRQVCKIYLFRRSLLRMIKGIYLDECCVRSLFFIVDELLGFCKGSVEKPGFLSHIALFQRQAQIPVIHRNGTCSLKWLYCERKTSIYCCYIGQVGVKNNTIYIHCQHNWWTII